MSFFDPFSTSQKLERSWIRAQAARRKLAVGPGAETPFVGEFPGKTLRDQILELDPSDPLRPGLLVWCDVLLELRLNFEAERREAWLYHTETHPPVLPLTVPASLAQIERRLIGAALDPEAGEEMVSLVRGLVRSSAGLSAARRERLSRRLEVEHRLAAPLSPLVLVQVRDQSSIRPGQAPLRAGLELVPGLGLASDARAGLQRPELGPGGEGQAGGAGVDAEDGPSEAERVLSALGASDEQLAALAWRCLDETEAGFRAFVKPGYHQFLRAWLAAEATEGWPARISRDSLRDLLGGDWLIRGLALPPMELPERLAPQSYFDAVLRLAEAISWAAAPRDLPFVVARQPAALEGEALGQMLGAWFSTGAFVRRRLGLSPEAARHARRALWLAQVARLRLLAARALLWRAAKQSLAVLDESSGQVIERLCGQELGPALGVIAVGLRSDAEFCGALLGWGRLGELRETHDDDFLDNPRARDQIRSELQVPARAHAWLDQLEQGLAVLLSLSPRD